MKAKKYSIWHLHVQSQIYVSNIFKVNIKDTKTISGASTVNFEHILPIVTLLLLLLNSKINAGLT